MKQYYAGIGSRETPAAIRARFSMLAAELAEAGWTLRSGGAEGADMAFEQGLSAHHPREIYLPWPRFAGNRSSLCSPTGAASALAAEIHPAWERCSAAARKLHARNMHQVLGRDLDAPVGFVVCWTPEGGAGGGTGQAIRLARARGIPIFDFGLGLHMHEELQAWLKARADRPIASGAADEEPGADCRP